MKQNQRKNLSRGALVALGIATGTALGTLAGALWFLVEPVWMFREVRSYFGSPMLTVWTLYLAFGTMVGIGAGLGGGAAAAMARPEGAAARLLAVVVGLMGAAYTVLFLLRDYTFPELRVLPPSLMGTAFMAVLLWMSIIWTGERVLLRRGIKVGPPVARAAAAAATLVLLFCIVAVGVRGNRLPRHNSADGLPDIVLVVVDALRPDHLGAYGYYRPTSPEIDELAREGVLFENAYAHGNRTILSMPSLLTSLYPAHHGAVGFENAAVPLPDDRVTLAQMLRAGGYTTVGLMSNVYLKEPFGLTRGFDRTEEFNAVRFRLSVYRALESMGLLTRPLQKVDATPQASVVTDRAIHYLSSAGDRPLFLLAHYMDAHHPYVPDESTLAEFDRKTSRADASALFMLTAAMVENPPPLPLRTAELERLVDFYDASIRYTDTEIGRLLDAIRYRDSDRETIVIFTSDHGDEFMEHGTLYHNNLLVEELIRVPLIFWRSDHSQPRRVQEMVRHVDVMPTIAELVGLTAPEGIVGQSIAASVTGGAPPITTESVSEGDFCTAINTPDWKIMHVDSSGAYYLYNLRDDPWGHYDVSHQFPDVFARLRERIDAYLKEAEALSAREPTQVNPETLRQLRALGYIQ